MAKQKFYVVWEGFEPGIYNSWEECKKYITNYPNAKYKSFKSLTEANRAFNMGYFNFKKQENQIDSAYLNEIDFNSIAVDAACSGNPGKMEYQGVVTKTKQVLFKKGPFLNGTNNVGEFLALVHALALVKEKKYDISIYSDSKIAISWVKQKKCKTKLKPNAQNEKLFNLIQRAELWLKQNQFSTPILKWETKKWGEIPADFGRK